MMGEWGAGCQSTAGWSLVHNSPVFRRLLDRIRGLLLTDDPPWRIALAVAVGVFISCTPTFGFQTLIALAVAWVARLNRAATVTGVWVNLPWVTPFVYAGALKLGSVLLPDANGVPGFWQMLILGTTVVGAAAAIVAWIVCFSALSWRRRTRLQQRAGETGLGGRPAEAATAREQEPAA
jgi:uncharacterized protein (DUF2062 family)